MLRTIALFFYTVWAYFAFIVSIGIAFCYYFFTLVFSGGKGVSKFSRYNRLWALNYGKVAGIRYEVEGSELVPRDRASVIVCNHSSTADMLIAAAGIDYDIRTLAKVELKKIPVLGFVFSKIFVWVDRRNQESRKRSMEQLKKVLNDNINILIFAEGTRNKTKHPLKTFYDGAFRIAIEAQVDIVPMVLLYTKRVFPDNRSLLHPGLLKCIYQPPIPTKGMTLEDVPALKEKVFSLMHKVITDNDEDYAAYKNETMQEVEAEAAKYRAARGKKQ